MTHCCCCIKLCSHSYVIQTCEQSKKQGVQKVEEKGGGDWAVSEKAHGTFPATSARVPKPLEDVAHNKTCGEHLEALL